MANKKDIQEIYEKSTIRTKNMKVSTTNPEFKDKIHMSIEDNSDIVHWYIKFNIPLDPKSISKNTMNVTDTDGYILDTKIDYDSVRNLIVISPTDVYVQNEYYVLNVSKKVRSQSGQNLQNEIHIVFKLIANEISEFQLLKSTIKVPKPRPRTKEYRKQLEKRIAAEPRPKSISKVYSMDEEKIFKDTPQHKLPYTDVKINFLIALVGILISIISIVINIIDIMFIGLIVCLVGIIHIAVQVSEKEIKSKIQYNFGVALFNVGRYTNSKKRFESALNISEENEMAEYALSKLEYYL